MAVVPELVPELLPELDRRGLLRHLAELGAEHAVRVFLPPVLVRQIDRSAAAPPR